MAPPSEDARVLNDLINSTLALLSQFTSSLSASDLVTDTEKAGENSPNPLSVLRDSAKLVKAHTTKLSLLAINKPFTPSAITSVLKELAATCLPAMMSGVQICAQNKAQWGSMMAKESAARVGRIFKEIGTLLEEIRSIAAGTTSTARRDSLSSTGVVWESCDALIELERLGVAGLAMQKAEQYRDTIKDAIQELQEWAEGDDTSTEGRNDGLLDSDDEGVDGEHGSIEDIFNAANSMPKDRPELKALVDTADGKLKKVVILYSAFLKRRIRTFKNVTKDEPKNEPPVFRLDELMLHLKRLPHQIDELVGCFYELDEESAKEMLEKCLAEAKAAREGMTLNWELQEDEFTEWLKKWHAAVT